MAVPTSRKWIALSLMAVVLPISLLATLRITGILPEPPIPETITKETISWEWDRPSDDVALFRNEELRSLYRTDVSSIDIGILHCDYNEQCGASPFNGRDGVSFHVYANASVIQGVIHSLKVIFRPRDSNSFIVVSNSHYAWPAKYNTTITSMKLWSDSTSPAHVKAKATGSPCGVEILTFWVFKDQELENHQLNVTLKANYYNGTANLEVNLPIQLNMTTDIGDDFYTATEIREGEYCKCLDTIDCADMYIVDVPEGQTVNLTMTPPEDADFNLYLYNSDQEQIASSEETGNSTESIIYYAELPGPWYVKVTNNVWWLGHRLKGVYKLNVQMTEG